ncbi:MAG: hypothetical protein FWF96_02995 [Kiritimatiellaeota bacterium]|nr:hypothetical protein [Kiritimatiellota bacterium]
MKEEEPKRNPNCPCKAKSCPRHGICKECQAFHKGGKTTCQKGEKK